MPPNRLYVFFGMVASGKSTLGRAWAERHGMAYYNSDVVRKELAGNAATTGRQEELNQGIYTSEFTRRTYDTLLAKAEADLAAGTSVVLDASYQSHAERGRVRALAQKYNIPVYFIYCFCPEKETKRRLHIRAADPAAVSDGRWEIYLAQKKRFEEPVELAAGELITLATDVPLEALLEKLDMLIRKTP